MKTDKINLITIASSDNHKVSKGFEEKQNQKLVELYRQFQEKPFEYAKIDYFDSKEPKVTTYPQKSFIKKIVTKFKSIFKKF